MKTVEVRYEVKGKEAVMLLSAKEVPHESYGLCGIPLVWFPLTNAGWFSSQPTTEEIIERLESLSPRKYGWFA